MLLLARMAPDTYRAAMQEDRATEWWTFALFLGAAAVNGTRALRLRRPGDALVALFCIVAAGEEISWGQRIIGYTPSDVFLARNTQQEANVHNLVEPFGQPKWTLILVLAAYGLLAPLLARLRPLSGVLHRVGFSAPHPTLMPWFAVAIVLLVEYPVRFTGEWVEALSGALFLAAAGATARALASAAAIGGLFAIGMEQANPAARRAAGLRGCAVAEATALSSRLADSPLARGTPRVHRRLWTLIQSGAIGRDILTAFAGRACPGEAPHVAARRHSFGIDPWGTAYWIRIDATSRSVYSFGPDRRRDVRRTGDDVVIPFGADPDPRR